MTGSFMHGEHSGLQNEDEYIENCDGSFVSQKSQSMGSVNYFAESPQNNAYPVVVEAQND